MISFDEAQACYGEHVRALASESVPTPAASGRVLAAPVAAAVDLPRFDQSAMDGYALRHQDVPAVLPLRGRAEAGAAAPALLAGSCVRILTGAPLPAGADTVVPQEKVDSRGDTVRFSAAAASGQHIRYRAEEVSAGQLIARPGQCLGPGSVAALCAAGVAAVQVTRAPRVCVLVTGDEVVPVGQPLSDSATPDANGPLIAAWLAAAGVRDVRVQSVADDAPTVVQALSTALQQADLIIINGIGFEDWVDDLEETGYSGMIVDTSDGILIKTHNEEHNHDEGDPHIWLNPVSAKIQVQNIANAFSNSDPANDQYYQSNAAKYIKELDLLDSKIRTELSNCKNDFIAFHDAFSYFAKEYNLNQHTIISSNDPHGEATAKTLEKIISTAKKLNIKVIFAEESVDTRTSEIIANEIGGKVLVLSPLEVVSDGTYISRMNENLENLKEALC